jgi:hypothetical protein
MFTRWCVETTRDRIGQAELVQGARGLAAGHRPCSRSLRREI